MKLVYILVLIAIILSACSPSESPAKVSAEIVGEWESGYIISSGTAGEIDGKMYLFLITYPGPSTSNPVIRVLDLHDPIAPVEVASLEAPVESLVPVGALELSGNVLYAPVGGAGEGGLWTVDVSDPTSPREIGLLDVQYPTINLTLSDNITYIAGFASQRFMLVDITSPTQPQQLGEFKLSREQHVRIHKQNMAVSGPLLYVIDRDGLDIVDISSPESPQEVGFYANPLWVDEELEAVENLQTGVTRQITEVDDILPDGFLDIALSGKYAYIAAGTSGLRVLDVANPASVREVAQLDIQEEVYHATVSGDLLCLLGMEMVDRSILHTIHIVDISEPESPVILDSVEDIPGFPPFQFIVATERYVYFVNLKTVVIIDIYASESSR
ncbi:hypothetical protein ACFLVQ_00110 [Chloroflexota bacterium]